MQTEVVPDEVVVRRTIAERSLELRLLRSIERALARYRREQSQAEVIREASDASPTTIDWQGGNDA